MTASTPYTAHSDLFAQLNLPSAETQPEYLFDLPELQFPERLNCAVELLDKAVSERGWGERIAIRGERESLTYRALLERANRIARVLIEDMKLVPGNRVLLRSANNPMLAACWFAVIKAGGIVVTTLPMLRSQELADVISKAQISHALCDQRLVAELDAARARCPMLVQVRTFNGDGDCLNKPESLEFLLETKSPAFTNVDTACDDTCLIAFTSGTTGRPKGTMHFHRDVMAICTCFPLSTLKAEGHDVFCGTPPLGFTFGLGGQLLFPLSIGASTVLHEKMTPERLLQLIEDYRVSVVFAAPTFYRMMMSRVETKGAMGGKGANLSSLRKCVSAGEVLPASTRESWQKLTGIRLIDGIGSTEMLHIFISADEDHARAGATGKPIPGYIACVFDEGGNHVPQGQIGRLAVKGPTGCRYLADERQRQYVQNGWNITGDAYLIDAEGYFVYQGRTDDMIISAGCNISGPEVEDVLLSHPGVAEAGVVGVSDAERGQIVKAFIVLREGAVPNLALVEQLQDYVKERVAPFKYPRQIKFVDHLPRTETGKLQRFKLRQDW
jgi:2-aminobenzoate-CoA ligase